MMLALLIAFFSLIALMVIHEFGHFIIAKKFGVKVEEFGIFYPPRLFGMKFGDTVYSINAIPLGAFVKIYGEEGGVDDYRSFSGLAIWKRIFIVLGGVIAFWIASIIIFSIVFLIGASVPVGDQDVAGFPETHIAVMQVQPNSPAQTAGLQAGDRLVQVSSMRYESAKAGPEVLQINKVADFQQFIKAHGGEQLELRILRNGQTLTLNILPRTEYPEGQGPTGIVLERFANVIKQSAWWQAPFWGVVYCAQITWQVLVGIWNVFANMFGGRGMPSGAELAGPVGITIFLAKATDYGAGFFLYFIGSISVLLAIFNLFPIPALDGGKLVFLIIEKIKGRPVSVNVEQWLTVFFFILLISMSLFITVKFDFPRAIEFWKAGLK